MYSSSTFELLAESMNVHNTISNVVIHPYSSVILTSTGERVFTDVGIDDEDDVVKSCKDVTVPTPVQEAAPGIQLWEVGYIPLTPMPADSGGNDNTMDLNANDNNNNNNNNSVQMDI